jgi:predicted NBD/HSP70 family sugar kinase
VNSLGIDVGKKKCRAALKDERGNIIREFFFSNNNEGISALIQSASHFGKLWLVIYWSPSTATATALMELQVR